MDQDSSQTASAEPSRPPGSESGTAEPGAAKSGAAQPGGAQPGGAQPGAHPRGSGPGAAGGEDGPGCPGGPGTVVYRTATGWRVGEEELPDLVSAIALADLLTGGRPAPPPPTADGTAGETPEVARLKLTITQLEHALANRVRVEQAIGALAERHRLAPREAFELLRGAARSRGRRVHDLAGEVVASVTNPLLPLPEELARPPRAQRSRGRPRPGGSGSG